MMSDIAKLNLTLAGVVFTLAAAVFIGWPHTEIQGASALASPYCATTTFDASVFAKAAYARDLATGAALFEKHEETQLPLASLTKLMTVYAASRNLSADDVVSITREARSPEGGSLAEGEVWRMGDLADYVLITSDNDGAHALALASAEKARADFAWFIGTMNASAKEAGLAQTYFTNDTGLDASESMGGNYGSAKDVALLLEHILRVSPALVEGSTAQEKKFVALSGESHEAENTTPIGAELEGAIASKTGFTDLAGRNLAVVFEPVLGHPIVAVILGSTEEERDNDMRAIAAASKKWLSRAILCKHDGY